MTNKEIMDALKVPFKPEEDEWVEFENGANSQGSFHRGSLNSTLAAF